MGKDETRNSKDKTEEIIENLDEKKVLDTLEAEGEIASSTESEQRVQKRLLDELGLFDVDLDRFDISEDLESRVEYLRYVNMDSDAQREYSDEVKQKATERLRELGYDVSRDGSEE